MGHRWWRLPARTSYGRDSFSIDLGEDPYRDRLMLAWARAGGVGNGAAHWHDLATLPQRWSAPKFPLRAADFISRGIAEGPALGHVLTLAEEAWMAADFPLEPSALAAIADQAAAPFRPRSPAVNILSGFADISLAQLVLVGASRCLRPSSAGLPATAPAR